MTTDTLNPPRLVGGEAAPPLTMPLLSGGDWSLADAAADVFTLVWVIRGVHCSFCKVEVEALAERLGDFADIGCSIVVASMDDAERAQRMRDEWNTGDVSIGYGMTEAAARDWGLFLSSKVKAVEPAVFAEPALYLVGVDGRLYAQFQSTAPWLRIDVDTLLRGVVIALKRGTPPRGRY